jgi:hypothetical protein
VALAESTRSVGGVVTPSQLNLVASASTDIHSGDENHWAFLAAHGFIYSVCQEVLSVRTQGLAQSARHDPDSPTCQS